MIPDPRIIDNIKKLKELGMSETDIKDNLVKMGLSPTDCDELIATAFDRVKPAPKIEEKITVESAKPEPKVAEKKEEKINSSELPDNLFDENLDISSLKEEEPIIDTTKDIPDITKGLDIAVLEEPIATKSAEVISKITTTPLPETNRDIWGSGLATTINTKLNEIDLKQTKMEEFLKLRISEEIDKYKKIQETSKQLLLSKINETVVEQTHDINAQLTKQLAQLKVEQVKLNKKADEIESGKKEIDDLIKKLQTFQSQMIENNNISQENINKIIATTTVKLNAKIKEINDILALQSRITQGLVKNTQTAITDEIKKLNDFKEDINKKINPQQLYDKLNQLETFKQQLASRYEARFENIKTEFFVKAREAFKEEINQELKEVNAVKDTIVAKTDPELISKKIEELDAFQTHLLSAIDGKISQSLKIYESAINQELKEKSNKADEEMKKIENAIVTLDIAKEKINELNMFKDQFIAIIDKNIEKMNNTSSLIERKIKEIEGKQKMI